MLSAKYSGRDTDPLRNIDPLETTLSPGADDGHWEAPLARAPLHATLRLPGSKSLTNRELVLAALADGPATLHAPLHSQDSNHMIGALRALGADIAQAAPPRKAASLLSFGLSSSSITKSAGSTGGGGDSPEANNPSLTTSVLTSSPIAPSNAPVASTPPAFGSDVRVVPGELSGSTTIDCGKAGTVMRFAPPIAALALGPTTFDADASARGRPMGAMIQALRALGADVTDNGQGALPFTVHGTGNLRGGEITIDASASSQFVSGLLLSAARFDEGLVLHHSGERLPSIPHIDMTIACLADHGVRVQRPENGSWVVEPQTIRAHDVTIEPDLSNAAPFLAAALVAGGQITVSGWPSHTTQVGDDLPAILETLGAKVSREEDRLTVTSQGEIRGIDLDLSHGGELAPVVVALATLASSPSVISGIGHLRGHETDRLAALTNNINGLGGAVTELEDGLRIEPARLSGGEWKSYDDHRMATAAAIIGLKVPGIVVDDVRVTAKTLPQFVELWHGMLHQ